MLQELAARTGASGWAIGSMLFFLAVWLVIAVRVVRARREDMEARARLALEGEATPRRPMGCRAARTPGGSREVRAGAHVSAEAGADVKAGS